MNNKISTMLSLVAVAVLATVGLSESEASNWNGHVWDDDNVRYSCISVSGITKTSNVDPCGDLDISSNYWEIPGSTLTINGVTSGSYEIPVYAWTSGISGAGKTVLHWNDDGDYSAGYVVMNKNVSWEDSTVDTSTDGYDWKTATGHEFGHVAGVGHYTNPYYIMTNPLYDNDANRYVNIHTKNHIVGNY